MKFLSLMFFCSMVVLAHEKRFVIDICSYNNSQWYLKNLESVVNQRYENYHVYYTDDASTDGTSELVESYIKNNGLEDKITLIKNTKRRRQLANHYHVIHLCNDDDIIVVLDGDDFFPRSNILSKLNKIYKDNEIWMTYGQYVNWPTMERGYCCATPSEVIREKSYRRYRWYWGHLRSYSARLAKKVRLDDLVLKRIKPVKELRGAIGGNVTDQALSLMNPYVGDFFPASADLALGYPMLEMAGNRVKFIARVMYMRNVKNEINTFKTQSMEQQYSGRYIRLRKSYHKLDNLDSTISTSLDFCLLHDGNVESLAPIIHSLRDSVSIIGTIYIVCNDHLFEQDLQSIPGCQCINISSKNMKEDFLKFLNNVQNSFLYIGRALAIPNEQNLSVSLKILNCTFARGLFFNKNKNSSTHRYAWTGVENAYFWHLNQEETPLLEGVFDVAWLKNVISSNLNEGYSLFDYLKTDLKTRGIGIFLADL